MGGRRHTQTSCERLGLPSNGCSRQTERGANSTQLIHNGGRTNGLRLRETACDEREKAACPIPHLKMTWFKFCLRCFCPFSCILFQSTLKREEKKQPHLSWQVYVWEAESFMDNDFAISIHEFSAV